MTMKKINLYLTEEQLKALEYERDRVGVPIAEQIRRAIDSELKHRELLTKEISPGERKETQSSQAS